MQQNLYHRKQLLSESIRLLNNVSPLRTLERGYGIVTNAKSHVVSSSDAVCIGDKLNVQLARGLISVTIEGTNKDNGLP